MARHHFLQSDAKEPTTDFNKEQKCSPNSNSIPYQLSIVIGQNDLEYLRTNEGKTNTSECYISYIKNEIDQKSFILNTLKISQ